jgi:hypothetical protein
MTIYRIYFVQGTKKGETLAHREVHYMIESSIENFSTETLTIFQLIVYFSISFINFLMLVPTCHFHLLLKFHVVPNNIKLHVRVYVIFVKRNNQKGFCSLRY